MMERLRGSSVAERRIHNPEVGGPSPSPATSVRPRARRVSPSPAAPRRSPQVHVTLRFPDGRDATVEQYREALLRSLRRHGFGRVGVDDAEEVEA